MRKFFFLLAAIVSLNLMATEGALPGGFTINIKGDKIQFSRGLLEFNATLGSHATASGTAQGTWRFAEYQWESHFGTRSAESNEWFSQFAYLSSGNRYAPYISYDDIECSIGSGNHGEGTIEEDDDWGVYNAISNGGNQVGLWRTLTYNEWMYLMQIHKWAIGTVNGVKGLIILPDDFKMPDGIIFINDNVSSWTVNNYNLNEWANLEKAGAVFLRNAMYWTSTIDEYFCDTKLFYYDEAKNDLAEFPEVNFTADDLNSVRLVQPYEKPVPAPKTLTGRFSVAADKQVIFSQGNLQYEASENIWQFAENQYDMVGTNNANIASNYSGWIDLFGWGTSGYNNKYPYMTSESENQYGNGANDIAGTEYDWGVYATISNGNNEAWRTLTKAEWEYMLQTRANAADKWGNATVADVPGLIILPDAWTTPAGLSFAAQQPDWTTNTYSADQWTQLENAGAIFLPAAARRDGTTIMSIDADVRRGYYWTSTANGNGSAYAVRFMEDDPASLINDLRLYGFSVRPARDKKLNEAIDQVTTDKSSNRKFIKDGQLLIEKNGRTYNAQGAEVK